MEKKKFITPQLKISKIEDPIMIITGSQEIKDGGSQFDPNNEINSRDQFI